MPVNVNNPEYTQAEKDFHEAGTLEEQLTHLQKMISHAPKHKGAENLRAQLKTKYKKLKEKIIKAKKSGKSSKVGIKKHDMQAAIIGKTNSGKSSLLSLLTNAHPKITESKFTTTIPVIGMMGYSGTNIQLIENPSIESEFYDKGLTNTADTLLIIVDKLEQIKDIEKYLEKSSKKRIIIFNDKNNLAENYLRKLKATLKSKKYDFVILNCHTKNVKNFVKPTLAVGVGGRGSFEGQAPHLQELKEKIFKSFNKIRIYTKEPGKPKTDKPIILNPDSTVKDVAEKILHGFSNQVTETRITGPSSKFPNQKVGMKHKLKDLDIIEFKTR